MNVYEYTYRRHKIAEIAATIRTPTDVAAVIGREMLTDRDTEALLVLSLDNKNHVIGVITAYNGNVSANLVRVGELFRDPVRMNAAAIIIVHNHPSGDATPSPDDLHLTAEVIAAGRLLDIPVLDHVVIGDNGAFVSLRDRGINFDQVRK